MNVDALMHAIRPSDVDANELLLEKLDTFETSVDALVFWVDAYVDEPAEAKQTLLLYVRMYAAIVMQQDTPFCLQTDYHPEGALRAILAAVERTTKVPSWSFSFPHKWALYIKADGIAVGKRGGYRPLPHYKDCAGPRVQFNTPVGDYSLLARDVCIPGVHNYDDFARLMWPK